MTSLAVQIEQFRGRELPGFMSAQAFYLCMSQYVDQWQPLTAQLMYAAEPLRFLFSMSHILYSVTAMLLYYY